MKVIVNGKEIEVQEGSTILEAVRKAGYSVPTLCHQKGLCEEGSCRVCVCEVNGRIMSTCTQKASEGMVVLTNTKKVLNARKQNLELLLSNHNFSCTNCSKEGKCKLQRYASDYNCDLDKYAGEKKEYKIDDSSCSIVRDNSKCILCGKCIEVCSKIQGLHVYGKSKRGFETSIGCAFNKDIAQSKCTGCGQCVLVCPTGALSEKNDINFVLDAISKKNEENIVTVQMAPAVRVALAEEFGNPIGTVDERKMVQALRLCGFDFVYDVNYGADLTVMEEEKELLERIEKGEHLPQFSSCCPGWYNFVTENFPQFTENVSKCKSPNEMLASLVKYKFEKEGKKATVVSIMPCTAKKHEKVRCGGADVVLTTRELAKLIRLKGIDFNALEGDDFDRPFGDYSGASVIFGVTGGVTEAVLRTAIYHITGEDKAEVKEVRVTSGIKEVEISAGGVTLRLAIVSGLTNARKVCEMIEKGEKDYHFVEVMACPGGCVNGGGQPFVDYDRYSYEDVIKLRSEGLFKLDASKKVRQSHKNTAAVDIYKDVLGNDEKLIKKLFHNE